MKRASRPSLLLWLAAATSPVVLGCGLNQEGVRPWQDTIGYPSSAVLDQSEKWLFVANSNADLRYNDGTLIALRLELAKEDRDNHFGTIVDGAPVPAQTCPSVNYVRPRGESGDFCCVDPLDPYIINCDERRYVEKNATVRIGSFAAGMVRQDPKCGVNTTDNCATCDPNAVGNATSRLLLAVRGDTSLTYVDVSTDVVDDQGKTVPLVLDCVGDSTDQRNRQEPDGPDEAFASCDKDHRIVETESALALASDDADPPSVRFPDEPYALAVDDDKGLLYVGHLSGSTNRPGSGGVSLFDVAPVNEAIKPPRFIATFANIFAPNSLGLMGITSLRWEPGRAVFATSRYLPMVTGLAATTALGCPGRKGDMEPIREIAVFGSGETYGTALTGTETRGIQFVKSRLPTGEEQEHAFVLQRVPPAVVDFYQAIPNQVLEVCQSPTFLQKNPAGDRLFVTCFDSGEIFVIDPFTPRVERIFSVGRGPAGLVFPENDPMVAYVVGFGDNNISVVDIEPGSRSQYHVIQRIGFPSSVPR